MHSRESMTDATDPRGGARVRLPAPLVLLVSILVGVALRYLVAAAPLPGPRLAQLVAGALLLVAGTGIGMPAYRLFKKTGQSPKPWTPSPELLARGPYRFSRNPMYVGMFAQQLGIGLLVGTAWVVGLSVVTLLVIHVTSVIPEEAYLEQRFGASYRDYKSKVRRYL